MSREYGIGGTERRLIDFGNYLSSIGYNINIFFGINRQNDSKWDKLRNSLTGRIWRLIKELYKFKPDIINTFDLESGIYYQIAAVFYYKNILHISGLGAEKVCDRRTKKILSKGWFLADVYICNNSKSQSELLYYLESKRKVYCIWNGLNPERLRLTIPEEKEINFLTSGKNVIGYIGKFDNIKHGERMLELAESMLNEKEDLNLHFLMVGDGPNISRMMEDITQLPQEIKSAITLTGQVNNAAVLAKYMKVGILCSDSEGFPNVLLEYMCFGVPWISTDVGDVKNILDYGQSGFVIDSWDIKLFTEFSIKLIKDKDLHVKMADEGKRLFNKKFLSKIMGEEYLRIYKMNLDE